MEPSVWIFYNIRSQEWTITGLLWSLAAGMTVGIVFTQVTSLATTLGLHRGMTHQAYSLSRFLNWMFRLTLWLSVGIKWWEWCRVHAYHHQHTETELDPHSPVYKGGLSNVFRINPHLYQIAANDPRVIDATGERFVTDHWDRWLFNREGLGRTIGIGICMLVFGVIPGVVAYIVHILAYIYLNSAINSIGHGAEPTGIDNRLERQLAWISRYTGKRPGYDPHTARKKTVGNSLNSQPLAWLTMGEGLHYNHHSRQRCATMRRFVGDHDPGLYFLYILRGLRLVGTFEVPAPEPLPS